VEKEINEFRLNKLKQCYSRKCITCLNEVRRAHTRAKINVPKDAVLRCGPVPGVRKPKKQWSEYPKEQRIAWTKKYKTKNRETILQRNKDYAKGNSEKRKATMKAYRLANPEKDAESVRRRQAAKMLRTPKWLTKNDIWMMQEAYHLARLRAKIFGFSWHVDHIIPLQGATVSGLHVPYNLQVIPAKQNLAKANKVNP
jgi:hypothetical protein